MNRVLTLGLKSSYCINLTSFAVTSRNLKYWSRVHLRVRILGSKKLFSNSLRPDSSGVEAKMEKKLKEVMATNQNLQENVVERNLDEIQLIKDDMGKIETMTVQELRNTLRRIGVPAKGRKQDLVSALRSFLDKKTNVESSYVSEEQVSSTHAESVTVKRKVKSSDEGSLQVDAVSEVSALQQTKRRVKPSAIENQYGNVAAKIVRTRQNLSIKTDEGSGGKLHQRKKKVCSNIGSQDVKAAENDLSVFQSEPWTVLAHKRPQKGWIPYNPRTMRPSPLTEDTKLVKLMSWNVNGLRALLKLEGFSTLQLAQRENFDILCLQETKLQEKDVESIKQSLIVGYEDSFWTCSASKLGYSGTAIISRIKPLSVRYGLGISDHDTEGRLVTAEFESFYLLSAYVPNSGDGLRRLSYRITEWDPALSNYMKELEKSKPVILTGDLNCAHEEIDIYDPAGNKRSAGFTIEERQSFGANFLSRGFVDTFRKQHPGVVGYTYWGYRHGGRKTNKGWRLDYFLVSECIADKIHDSYILPDVSGSDHCPIGLVLKL